MNRRERYERTLDNIWHLERALGWEPTVRAPKYTGKMRTAKDAAEAWTGGASRSAAIYAAMVESRSVSSGVNV